MHGHFARSVQTAVRPAKVILSLPDRSTAHAHVFLRHILNHVPGTLEVLETCTVDVSSGKLLYELYTVHHCMFITVCG